MSPQFPPNGHPQGPWPDQHPQGQPGVHTNTQAGPIPPQAGPVQPQQPPPWPVNYPSGPPQTHGYPYGPPPQAPPYPSGPPAQPTSQPLARPPAQGQPGPWNVQSPWQQAAGSTLPPHLQGQQHGPNVTTPMGRIDPEADSIDNYAAPRRRWPWWLAGGLAFAVVIALAATQIVPRLVPGTSTSANPTASATATDSLPEGATTYETEEGDAAGYWLVEETEWSDDAVEVRITIAVDSGTLHYSFAALGNSSDQAVEGSASESNPSIDWEHSAKASPTTVGSGSRYPKKRRR